MYDLVHELFLFHSVYKNTSTRRNDWGGPFNARESLTAGTSNYHLVFATQNALDTDTPRASGPLCSIPVAILPSSTLVDDISGGFRSDPADSAVSTNSASPNRVPLMTNLRSWYPQGVLQWKPDVNENAYSILDLRGIKKLLVLIRWFWGWRCNILSNRF